MNSSHSDPIQAFWDDLLSRQKKRVLRSFSALDHTAKAAVWQHLQRMAGEDGWHPQQTASAKAAMRIISDGGIQPADMG